MTARENTQPTPCKPELTDKKIGTAIALPINENTDNAVTDEIPCTNTTTAKMMLTSQKRLLHISKSNHFATDKNDFHRSRPT